MRTFLLLLLALACPTAAGAQQIFMPSALAPSLALAVGSGLDLAFTLDASTRGATEQNPLLAHHGTAGLVVTKAALTVALVVAITKLTHGGHPTLAKVLGYGGAIVFTSVALRNTGVRR
jgi:hypothetical protein